MFEDVLPSGHARSDLALERTPAAPAALLRSRSEPAAPLRAFTNRFEIKYLVETRRLDDIRAALADLLVPDRNGSEDGGYYVHSVYYDSPDLRFYREKMEGQLRRVKPRLRSYRDGPDGPPTAMFMELKGRYDRIVTKRRSRLDAALAQKLLSDAPVEPNGWAAECPVLSEFQYLSHRFRLMPCVSVLYHRTAFFGTFCPNLRVTFDRLLQCSPTTGLTASSCAFTQALSYDRAIVELKYNDKVPRMLLNRIYGLGLQHRTFSKYAISVKRSLRGPNGGRPVH